jgi:hypothetical protein
MSYRYWGICLVLCFLGVGAFFQPTQPVSAQDLTCYDENNDAIDDFFTDADADGLDNCQDFCPQEMGFGYTDGCPDIDGDEYGDHLDVCPFDGDMGQGVDERGCPLGFADLDGDGIFDVYDACPDVYGYLDSNFAYGCPDNTDGTQEPPQPSQMQPNPPTQSSHKSSGNRHTTAAPICSPDDAQFLAPRLGIGGLGEAADEGANRSFHLDPDTASRQIGVIQAGDDFIILDGSRCSTENDKAYRWWYIYFDGQAGWLAESDGSDYLVKPVEAPASASIRMIDLEQDQNGEGFSTLVDLGNLPQNAVISASVGTQGISSVSIRDANQNILRRGKEISGFQIPLEGTYILYGQSPKEGVLVVVILLPDEAGRPQFAVPGRPTASTGETGQAGATIPQTDTAIDFQLEYGTSGFSMTNISDSPKSLAGLTFSGSSGTWDAATWNIPRLRGGDCVQLYRFGDPQPARPPNCNVAQSWLASGDNSVFFWQSDFTVSKDGITLAGCSAVVGICSFSLGE